MVSSTLWCEDRHNSHSRQQQQQQAASVYGLLCRGPHPSCRCSKIAEAEAVIHHAAGQRVVGQGLQCQLGLEGCCRAGYDYLISGALLAQLGAVFDAWTDACVYTRRDHVDWVDELLPGHGVGVSLGRCSGARDAPPPPFLAFVAFCRAVCVSLPAPRHCTCVLCS